MPDTTHRFIPRLTDEQLRQIQLDGLRYTLRQARNSPQYRARLDACGARAEDIHSLDDLRLLPTVDVEDLREGYPLPLLCVPEKDVVRIHASSGTTGKRKILAYSAATSRRSAPRWPAATSWPGSRPRTACRWLWVTACGPPGRAFSWAASFSAC